MKYLPFNSSFLITALMFAVIPFGVVWYLYSSISSERERIEELARNAKTLTDEGDRLSSVRAQLQNTEDRRKELDTYFISQNTIPDFLALVESLGSASTTRVEIRDVAVEESAIKTSTIERLRFTVLIQGAFAPVLHRVELIEALPYDVVIEQIAIDQTGEGGLWRAAISASAAKLKN